jgi:SAM-dependent methyltransferase
MGGGTAVLHALFGGDGGEVIGIDNDDKWVDKARKKHSQCTFQCADILTFDDTADVIFMLHVLDGGLRDISQERVREVLEIIRARCRWLVVSLHVAYDKNKAIPIVSAVAAHEWKHDEHPSSGDFRHDYIYLVKGTGVAT